MRHYHCFCPAVSLGCEQTLANAAQNKAGSAPIVDVQLGYSILGKAKILKQPVIVKAKMLPEKS